MRCAPEPVCRPGGEWGGRKENLKPSHIIFPRDQLKMDSSSIASWVKQSWKKQDETEIFIHAFPGSFFRVVVIPVNKINIEKKIDDNMCFGSTSCNLSYIKAKNRLERFPQTIHSQARTRQSQNNLWITYFGLFEYLKWGTLVSKFYIGPQGSYSAAHRIWSGARNQTHCYSEGATRSLQAGREKPQSQTMLVYWRLRKLVFTFKVKYSIESVLGYLLLWRQDFP